MPFVTHEHRLHPDLNIPGDRCYVEYQKMMDFWRLSPRWTTVDALAKQFCPDEMERTLFLAFMVFFNRVVMPYEEQKVKEHGDI